MLCPVDNEVELVMSERQGVEIDYCPACRGVWLDRGELDKILDHAAAATHAAPIADRNPIERERDRHDDRHDDRHGSDRDGQGRKKKGKGSWLGDLLDF